MDKWPIWLIFVIIEADIDYLPRAAGGGIAGIGTAGGGIAGIGAEGDGGIAGMQRQFQRFRHPQHEVNNLYLPILSHAVSHV